MGIKMTTSSLNLTILIVLSIVNTCLSIRGDDLHISQERANREIDENFLIVDHLNDNEKETRIKWRDLMGKETTLELDGDERYANSSFARLSLWQISDGHKFVQLVFNNQDLIECEFLRDGRQFAEEFTDKFIEDFNIIRRRHLRESSSSKKFSRNHHQYFESSNLKEEEVTNELDDMKPNVTFIYLRRLQDIPESFLNLMHLHMLEYKCDQLHETITENLRMRTSTINDDNGEEENQFDGEIAETRNGRTKRQTDSWFIAPRTKWCGKGRSAESYSQLGPSKGDVCCRKHDHCRMSIPSFRSKFGLFNQSPFAMSHCRCDRSKSPHRRRHKRDLNNFMIPYTKWCGKGWSAKKYSEIGGFSKTDKCCRSHDFCPHWIGSFKKKWSVFNWSINVIMHCRCDERFRTCLKMADSADANIVGKLFFNFMQIKCFVLKPEKSCILHSWWGKCLKFKTKKKAYLRDNQKY